MTSQLLLVILLLFSGIYIYKLCGEKEHLKRELNRYATLSSQEGYVEELEDEILSKRNQVISLEEEYKKALRNVDSIKNKLGILTEGLEFEDEIANKHNQVIYLEEQYKKFLRNVDSVKGELGILEEELELQSFGFYQPKYDFLASSDYVMQLNAIRAQQKQLAKNGSAVLCPISWSIGDSKRDGKKFVNSFQELILKVFNENCDEIISKTKPGKIDKSRLIMERKFSSLNKTSQIIQCKITGEYLDLKFRELDLTYEMELIKQEEKEIAKQSQLDKKERDKLEKAEAEVRETEQRELVVQQRIYDVQQKQKDALAWSEVEKEEMRLEIEKLQSSLKDTQNQREAAEVRVRKCKSGHIFIISNIGSFGRDIYRICLTTSVDEDSYISVMNPIVPFPFDIHVKFFSEDAREMLKLLHEQFHDKRVNKINLRRDFFRASFEEISQAIESLGKNQAVLNLVIDNKVPNAYEYRRTEQQEKSLVQKKAA